MTSERELDGERWIEIADAMAVGDEVPEADAAYLREHTDSAEAKLDERIWTTVAAAGDELPAATEADDDAVIDRVVAGAREREAAEPRRRLGVVVGIGSVLAAAAAVALWVNAGTPETEVGDGIAKVERAAPTAAPARVVQVGAFNGADKLLGTDDAVPLAQWLQPAVAEACIGLTDAEVCTDEGSRIRLTSDDVVELGSGFATVTIKRGRTTPVAVKTSRGTAKSSVGKFRVNVAAQTQVVTIAALVGPVTVEDPLAGTRELAEGSTLVLGEDAADTSVIPETETATDAVASRAKPRASAEDLLRRAQDRMTERDDHGALVAYRRLLSAYPNSPVARTALISTAKLELKAGHTKSALRHFNRYLARGGANAEEAHHGRIKALEKLGREQQELSAIGVFLDKYPRSAHAAKLRNRAQRLRGNTP